MSDPKEQAQRLLATTEAKRLQGEEAEAWRRFGPYLSERQWGTVREDYSRNGDAWTYLPHDHARSRAYRWGEDGIAGFGDENLNWCLSLALWNGRDPFLKERLFGLTNAEGNHGEDVKELYFYLDATPSHSYLRMLYKYPQLAFPYEELRRENGRRTTKDPEYELLDTGIFEGNRYFDVTVEYAKASPDDILMRIGIVNQAAEAATLHVLPQLLARNIWSWDGDSEKPWLKLVDGKVIGRHAGLEDRELVIEQACEFLFCENETNVPRLFGVTKDGPFKDGINDFVIAGQEAAIRRDQGTKCAAHMVIELAPGASARLNLRFRPVGAPTPAFADFETVFASRMREADEFYAALQTDLASDDAKLVQRQALAGMIWSKQFYDYDVRTWLAGDHDQPPPPPERRSGRNHDWEHLSNSDIVSMPDTWEYPWYASWDLCFQAVTFAMIDPGFAKNQLLLLMQDRFMHPNGQLPAYEWEFSDANPPLHAWAAWRIYEMDKALTGRADQPFLERIFHKLLLNFGWWVNRKDADGRNVFQGGFLGLDNIGIFDRSSPLPTGGHIDQADGTAWMAKFALTMMRMALELAMHNHVYEDIAVKFFEHFLFIAEAMSRVGMTETDLWNEDDQFFYDVLRLPNGHGVPLRVRSAVGLMPLMAVNVIDFAHEKGLPKFAEALQWFFHHRPDLAGMVSRWMEPGQKGSLLLALLRGHRMKAVLARMLDETEFLSDYGVRSVSKYHEAHPYVFHADGKEFSIGYVPGESDSRLFGGNSNWRGPIWMPLNYLLIESLYEFESYYSEDFLVEYPVGSGKTLPLGKIAAILSERLTRLSLKGPDGRRPVMAAYPGLDKQPGSESLVLFHEYYHGDTGRGVGASHQTGWSGLVALLLRPRTRQEQEHEASSG
ncbi:Glycosyl hydrolase family 63 C-terminal domain-containing protein [Rhizobiales bacterium GAS113]|nr:Glycosyl hydrolase family 63 C-terminal domain-containing protein [Rhizobiales bacterium GAS113]